MALVLQPVQDSIRVVIMSPENVLVLVLVSGGIGTIFVVLCDVVFCGMLKLLISEGVRLT